MTVIGCSPLDSVLLMLYGTVPLSVSPPDDFTNRIKGAVWQVCHEPVAWLDCPGRVPVCGGSGKLVRAPLIGVAIVGVLVLHQPLLFLKAMQEYILSRLPSVGACLTVEVYAPVVGHYRSPCLVIEALPR